MDMPSFVSSRLSQSVMVKGRRFEMDVYRAEDEDLWPLDVVSDEGTSFIGVNPLQRNRQR